MLFAYRRRFALLVLDVSGVRMSVWDFASAFFRMSCRACAETFGRGVFGRGLVFLLLLNSGAVGVQRSV